MENEAENEMNNKCQNCETQYSQDDSAKIYEATGQEAICINCADNYVYSQGEERYIHFDDAGDELSYTDWTENTKAVADKYADTLESGWPIVCS